MAAKKRLLFAAAAFAAVVLPGVAGRQMPGGVDGRPCMPLGFFASFGQTRDIEGFRKTMSEWKAAGANMLLESRMSSWGDELLPDVLKTLGENDILLTLDVSEWRGHKELIQTEYRAVVERLRGEPSLFGYCLADEATVAPEPCDCPVRMMIDEVDPDHPIWVRSPFDPAAYLRATDCSGADGCTILGGLKGLECADAATSKSAPRRPSVAWLCPQCFSETNCCQRIEEAMLSAALLQASWGAKGFVFCMRHDLCGGPDAERGEACRQAMLRSIRRLRDLEPYIMSGKPVRVLPHTNFKGCTRVVALENAAGEMKILVIGLGKNNKCSFPLPGGGAHMFIGKELSCEML